MGVKETFGNTIRIVVVVHVLMVATMFGRSKKNRILEGASAENDCEEPHDPVSLEC